jgi:DNA-binding IclR family transcriptional regulator
MAKDDAKQGQQQRSVQSVEVGGRLLLALAQRPVAMSLKELAALADLTPSRAHPYLVSFARLGLVVQDPSTGQYAPGPAALQLGLSCLHQSDAIQSASEVAQALAQQIDQAVAVAVWANFGPTVVRMFEGSQPLHVNMRAGTVMALFGTATGEAFAATLPRQEIERALAALSGQRLGRARASSLELAQQIQQVSTEFQRHGLTRALGRPIPNVNALSAPVRNHEGLTVLVLTALGHEEDFPPEWDSALAHAVRSAAAEVSRRLGYHPAAG